MVFVRNKVSLSIKHPEVHAGLLQRISTKFALMGLKESQEHSVKHLKDGGSIIGLKTGEKEVIEISRPEDALIRLKTLYIIHTADGDSIRHPDSLL